MNENRWPALTIYDFLGYFIPGALGVYLWLIVATGSLAIFAGRADPSWPEGMLFFLVAYVVGHLLSFLSALLIETYAVDRYGYPSRYLFGERATPRKHMLSRLLLRLPISPLTMLNWIIGDHMGLSRRFTRPCDPRVGQAIQNEIKVFFCLRNLGDVEFFHLIAHWVREHAPGHGPILQAHVARKGFLRTLSLLMTVAVWIGVGMYANTGDTAFLALGIVSMFAAYLAFLAYLKQERRFTLETLMAFTVAFSVIDESREPRSPNTRRRRPQVGAA